MRESVSSFFCSFSDDREESGQRPAFVRQRFQLHLCERIETPRRSGFCSCDPIDSNMVFFWFLSLSLLYEWLTQGQSK